ncbi:transcriptional regulator, MarR family [Paucidesulfovibrio gracilis DSM 16080]|uniref:Transcriptional regulator, MarR family n=1 Tax=Paucidesulfovibrio gracilis DSM 16080 TaxID=1121449 RepID=A0A1T4W9N2_9BACT|nr:MarR family transcriptional regulator [Paucidesulfovibrio gracilis]SKA73748.1 transcriptional regulator, MarR family [Paucidesulfovibrio gracilis DSM 16080]
MSPEQKNDLAQLIVEFYEKLSSWEHGVVRGTGLTPTQMHVIEILGANNALRMKELAQRMGVTTGSLTVVADKLEQRGLLRRRPNDTDRRSILVELTENGKQRFAEHDKLHMDLTRDIVADLSSEESALFAECLRKINRNF